MIGPSGLLFSSFSSFVLVVFMFMGEAWENNKLSILDGKKYCQKPKY
jgi:hypothetical protein